ncbi:MAG: hypothetical protein LBQ75_06010 [Zoogloeaceae bacterium]|nr:hypothetical protein [Zoogloeaceae bacterium]
MPEYCLHTKTPLADGLCALFRQLADRILLDQPVRIFLAGAMAVHLYSGSRVTTDVDAEFDKRTPIPGDLSVSFALEDDVPHLLYLDTNYNTAFSLMHENYRDDAIPVALDIEPFRLYVLSPVDLVVSKIARFQEHDRADIAALVRGGLVGADEIEARALEAEGRFDGYLPSLRFNIQQAVQLARDVEAENRVDGSVLQREQVMKSRVNLLDPTREPSDEDFEEIFSSMAVKFRAGSEAAHTAFWDSAFKVVEDASSHFAGQNHV